MAQQLAPSLSRGRFAVPVLGILRTATFLFALSPSLGFAQPVCGDFLLKLEKKPANLEFLGCEKTKDAHLDVLKATYRVAGKAAPAVLAAYSGQRDR